MDDFLLPFLLGLVGSLIGTGITAYAFYRLRYRILRATMRDLRKAAPDELKDAVLSVFCEWEDKKDKDGNKVREYKPAPFLLGFFESVVPVIVEIGWRSMGNKLGNLPIGPDGKMNMLAPVVKRMMDGKKIGFNDFLPFLMEKVAPLIQGVLGGLTGAQPAGGAAPAATPTAVAPKVGAPPG